MKIYSNRLKEHLAKQLDKVYIFASDEPFWLMNAAEMVVEKACQCGFSRSNKERFTDDDLNLDNLSEALTSPGLFADNIIVEINLSSLKPKNQTVLQTVAKSLHDDLVVIITLPQISQADLRTKNIAALDKLGISVIFYQATDQEIYNLIADTCSKYQIVLNNNAQALLKQTYEGNLFALCQSIEKLNLCGFTGNISLDVLKDHIENDNHFSIFTIIDTFINNQISIQKRLRVLNTLRDEGENVTDMVNKLGNALSTIYEIRCIIDNGGNLESFFESHPLLRSFKQKRDQYINTANTLSLATLKYMLKLICKADILARSFNEDMAFLYLREIVAMRSSNTPLITQRL